MSRVRPQDGQDDALRRRMAAIESDRRYRARIYWRLIGGLLAVTLVGLGFIALGVMSSHPRIGPALFWFGVLAADLGFIVLLGWGYLQLEE